MANMTAFFQALFSNPKNLNKLIGRPSNASGQRVFPSRTPLNDKKLRFRVDQGATTKDGRYNLVIQENGVSHGDTLTSVTVTQEDTTETAGQKLLEAAQANGHTVDDE